MRARITKGSYSPNRKSFVCYMANGRGDGKIIPDLTEEEYEAHKDILELLPSTEDEDKATEDKLQAQSETEERAAKAAAKASKGASK